jgi:hypothetical protein
VPGIWRPEWPAWLVSADFHAGGSPQLLDEFVADGASVPPGDAGICGPGRSRVIVVKSAGSRLRMCFVSEAAPPRMPTRSVYFVLPSGNDVG